MFAIAFGFGDFSADGRVVVGRARDISGIISGAGRR
jgi:hypothetical protein